MEATFIPDAGLVGIEGFEWEQRSEVLAYHRTPFAMLQGARCEQLESVPQDWPVRIRCDLDETPVDFVSLQGCASEAGHHRAAGRMCTDFDFDINATWGQWWMDGYAAGGGLVIETDAGVTDRWALTPDSHRDDRCTTNPDEWPPCWMA